MEKYIKEIQRIEHTAGRTNRTMRKKFVGPKIQSAGMDFLEQIRNECKLGATEEELKEEQEMLKEQSAPESVKKPELTFEYLKSINREDLGSW